MTNDTSLESSCALLLKSEIIKRFGAKEMNVVMFNHEDSKEPALMYSKFRYLHYSTVLLYKNFKISIFKFNL